VITASMGANKLCSSHPHSREIMTPYIPFLIMCLSFPVPLPWSDVDGLIHLFYCCSKLPALKIALCSSHRHSREPLVETMPHYNEGVAGTPMLHWNPLRRRINDYDTPPGVAW
jgi:hypothetical protein